MQHETIALKTQDGDCPTHVFTPDGDGPWPGALMYMDGIGMRSALVDMAARLSAQGYYVLLPNLFWRVGYNAEHGVSVFSDPVTRKDLMERIMPSASPANVMRDTEAFLAHFAAQPKVRGERIGITGYCMGGRLALYAAGHFGERIGAMASYHGGGMATDAPDSPHRSAANIRATVYVAGASEDQGFDDAQKARLDAALTEAKVEHVIETYPARHGWVPADTPVHDAVQTERHWKTLLRLFGGTIARQ